MIAAKNNYGIVLKYTVFILYIWKKTIIEKILLLKYNRKFIKIII